MYILVLLLCIKDFQKTFHFLYSNSLAAKFTILNVTTKLQSLVFLTEYKTLITLKHILLPRNFLSV